jgi:hypothetical protein
MSSAARAAVGSNMSVLAGTGDANTGNSGASVLAGSEATTAGLVVRVIDTVDETKTAADTFVELIVKINLHQTPYLVSNTLSMVMRLPKSSKLSLLTVLSKKKLNCPVSVPRLLRVKVLQSSMTMRKKRGLLVTLTRQSLWASR